jgi:hypothetical protein
MAQLRVIKGTRLHAVRAAWRPGPFRLKLPKHESEPGKVCRTRSEGLYQEKETARALGSDRKASKPKKNGGG